MSKSCLMCHARAVQSRKTFGKLDIQLEIAVAALTPTPPPAFRKQPTTFQYPDGSKVQKSGKSF